MTFRAYLLALLAVFLLFIAFSVGSMLALYIALALLAMLALSLLCALCGFATLRVHLSTDNTQVLRGEAASLRLTASLFSPLPLAPTVFAFLSPDGDGEYDVGYRQRYLGSFTFDEECVFPHVGTFEYGVSTVRVRDVFSLFCLTRRLHLIDNMLVLPCVSDAEPMPFSAGDEMDVQLEKRARDDATMPADVRAYQQGDDLRRVHWKLSLRKRQLMVRTFDVPALPDALILMDCAMPERSDMQLAYTLRDALCESAVSLAGAQLAAGHAVHMPLCGRMHIEAGATTSADLPGLQRQCALCDFEGDPLFERILLSETRRLRRTGATAILTTRLNPRLVDLTRQISRLGPCVRFIFISELPPDEEQRALLERLADRSIAVEIKTLSDSANLPEEEDA